MRRILECLFSSSKLIFTIAMPTPENQLNLRARHPDFQIALDFNESESKRVLNTYSNHLDLAYGEEHLQSLDIFPSAVPNSPVHIFIHGGYWKALDKSSYRFIAAPFVDQNISVCLINYRLIPSVHMESLLNDIRAAFLWIQVNISQYNGNPSSMVISGHSAGGHLALMAYLMNKDLQASIKGICSLSGIFDLGPIKNSYLNEDLQLTDEDIENYSVINKDLGKLKCPTLLSVGSAETDLFIEESKNLYKKHKSRAPLRYYEYPELNHYEIVHKLGESESPLVQFILPLIS
ncbi:MAG: alpha/beta hydrolase [Bacteroidota bacterium]